MGRPYVCLFMRLKTIDASGHPNASSGNLSAHVEDWGQSNVRHHIRQQGIQIAQNKIDMPHDVTKVHAAGSGWDVKAVLLVDDDTATDDLLGELFAADSWKYDKDEATVQYYNDAETDQQEQVRQRAGDAVAEQVADETAFDTGILAVSGVTIQDRFSDRVSFNV